MKIGPGDVKKESSALLAAMEALSGGAGTAVRLKVVPGASRSRLLGLLGDRLKVAVAAAPEGGKANAAVCELLAEALGLPERDVNVTSGASQPRKTVTVAGLAPAMVAERLGARGKS